MKRGLKFLKRRVRRFIKQREDLSVDWASIRQDRRSA